MKFLSIYLNHSGIMRRICPFKIIRIISIIHMIFHPRTSLRMPARIFPSENRVTAPQIQDVTGIIAKIILIILPKPK